MRPVKATGWKLMPLVHSMYSSASRRMSPIWWSLRPLTIVGTNTIFRPAFLTFSMHRSFFSHSDSPRVRRYTSSQTPSNWR